MRLGEAIALAWTDLSERAAEIRRSIVDGKITTPKSAKGRRVDLSTRLVGTLRSHQARCTAAALAAGTGERITRFHLLLHSVLVV